MPKKKSYSSLEKALAEHVHATYGVTVLSSSFDGKTLKLECNTGFSASRLSAGGQRFEFEMSDAKGYSTSMWFNHIPKKKAFVKSNTLPRSFIKILLIIAVLLVPPILFALFILH